MCDLFNSLVPDITRYVTNYCDKASQFALSFVSTNTQSLVTKERISIDEIALEGHLEIVKWSISYLHSIPSVITTINAALRGHLHIVEYLHNTYPKVSVGLPVLAAAARNGHISILQWYYDNVDDTFVYTSQIITSVIRRGHVEVLEWIETHSNTVDYTEDDFHHSIYSGDLEMFKYIHSHTVVSDTSLRSACSLAGRLNAFEILKWLHSMGYTWEINCKLRGLNNIEILDWCVANNISWNFRVVVNAAQNGDAKFLRQYIERGYEHQMLDSIAASCGHITLLDLLKEYNLVTPASFSCAAQGGIKTLDWMYNNGIRPDSVIKLEATYSDDIADWFISKGIQYEYDYI